MRFFALLLLAFAGCTDQHRVIEYYVIDADGDIDGDIDGDTDGDIDGDGDSDFVDADTDGDAEAPELPAACAELPDGAASGIYTLADDVDVYCDMTTLGGGWTALLNPVGDLPAYHPDIAIWSYATETDGSCDGAPQHLEAHGFNAVAAYVCRGSVFLTVAWDGPEISELLFSVTVQGVELHRVVANNEPIDPADAIEDCYFWHGPIGSTEAPPDRCWVTSPAGPAQHHVLREPAPTLTLTAEAGPATTDYGAGAIISRLFVR